MLEEPKKDLADFFTNDPRGRHVPAYLSALCTHLIDEKNTLASDLGALERLVQHVRDIIHLQQDYSRPSGMIESVGIHGVIEDALQLNSELSTKHNILNHHRAWKTCPIAGADRHKLLQILINLISNAQHALVAAGGERKTLLIRLTRVPENRIRIALTDNGMGIDPQNLTRIFQHGFTTRTNGHGFGLHSKRHCGSGDGRCPDRIEQWPWTGRHIYHRLTLSPHGGVQ